MISRFAAASPVLGLCSLMLTFALWGWIWTRPPGTFNDQGGLAITLIYFPSALLGWLVFGLPGLVLGVRGLSRQWRQEAGTDARGREIGSITWSLLGIVLSSVGLLVAIGTRVTA